jgi:fucose permease
MPIESIAALPARSQWRRAIRVQFFVLGMAMGVWGAMVPAVKRHYGLDERGLSIALLVAAIGAVLCLLHAGAWVARWGARRCIQGAGLLLCASLALLPQTQSYAALLAWMLALGAGSALFDVAINAEGNALEAAAARKLMSGLHAMFSLGGMAGALWCALLYRVQVAIAVQMFSSAIGLAALLLVMSRPLSSSGAGPDAGAGAAAAWPRGLLLWMGGLTALCLLAEGAMYDWSALYVEQTLRTDAATGALAFAAFSAAMAAGRLFGDQVRERHAPAAVLRASGALAAVGMAIALLLATPWAAMLGFALAGLGLANVVPVLFAAAAQVPGVSAARGVAAVSSVGYFGFMVGPPLIGALAHASSLGAALWAVALFALLMAVAARPVLGTMRG